MIKIVLNKTEQAIVTYIAKQRFLYDRRNNAQATRYNWDSAIKAEVDSFGAELAYCKMQNCYPDLDTEHFAHFDANKGGLTVDVKQTSLHNGRLLVKVKDRANLPDLYALMIGQFPVYEFVGHMSAEELIQEWRIDHTLAHPAYAADQSEMMRERI